MSVLTAVLEALQVVSARGLTEARAAESYSCLCTVMKVLSQHPMDDTSIDEAMKAFTVCITHADKLCGMAPESAKHLGLSAMAISMQNCSRKLFLDKFSDVWNRVNTLARGNSVKAAAAACETLVQMLKRLHTFMAAQGVKTVAVQPVGQTIITALQLLRSGPALIQSGLSLMEAALECMPQAARSQFQAACVATHSIIADLQLPLELRLRASRVLAALPASQNSPDAHSQHLQGLLSALHASLSTIPAPVTDAQASQAAREALGDKLQGSWSSCVMVPPAAASHHVPPQQRLDAITVLMECLTETLSRRQVPPVVVPVSPAILLVSRLVAHRPLHVPFSEEQFTATERSQLLLSGTPLLKSGLTLLQLLMRSREQLKPMAAALSRLLSELLLDASTPNRLPEDVRGTLYATVSTALRAFSPQEVQPVLETLVPCAWAEFATPEVPGSKGVAQPAGALKVVQGATTDAKANGTAGSGGRRGNKRKRKTGEDGERPGNFGETLDHISMAVEHAHRPANIHHVTTAQVRVMQCIEAMHDIVSGSLPPQLQVDVDVFTVSVLESCHWSRQLVLTDARIHDVQGVAAVKKAATVAVAAMCRSGLQRNGQVPMAERITALLQQQPRDPATEAVEGAALQALSAAAALAAAQKAAQSAILVSNAASNTAASTNKIKNGTGVARGVAAVAATNGSAAREFGGSCAAGSATNMHGGKSSPLEPEFEHMLSMRVSAVIHRGMQLACGLGAIDDPQNTAVGGGGEGMHGTDAVMEGSAQEDSHAQHSVDLSERQAPGGAMTVFGAQMHGEMRAQEGQAQLGLSQQQHAMHELEIVPMHGAAACVAQEDAGSKVQGDACTAAPSCHVQVNAESRSHVQASLGAPQSATCKEAPGVAPSKLSGRHTQAAVPDINRADHGSGLGGVGGGKHMHEGFNSRWEGSAVGRQHDVSVVAGSVAVGKERSVEASRKDHASMDVRGVEKGGRVGGVVDAAEDDSDAIPEIDSGPSDDEEEEI